MADEPAGKTEINPQAGGLAGLEQVREILFGAFYRDLQQRLGRADLHVAARVHELEQESRRRTEVLEAHLKKETEALAARVERQLGEINDALRNLTRTQHQASEQSEQRMAKAEEANATGLRDLREQLLDQAKSFLDELQGLRREVLVTVQRELGLEEGGLTEDRGEADRSARH